jgi:hypothetical protein
MTSFRQIEANRGNAVKSTGPSTEEGKLRSRLNAIRHGLCAETVIDIIEDSEDYRTFEAAIIADYDAETAVEGELVLRLASLLWRLRRATSIETDLLRIQAEILRNRRDQTRSRPQPEPSGAVRFRILDAVVSPGPCRELADCSSDNDPRRPDHDPCGPRSAPSPVGPSRDLAHSFQRLAHLDNGAFERLGRYETALWRQMVQTLLVLQSASRR